MRCFLAFIFFSYKILLNSFVIIYLFGVGGITKAVASTRAMSGVRHRLCLAGERGDGDDGGAGSGERRGGARSALAMLLLLLLRGCSSCTARAIYSYVSIYL